MERSYFNKQLNKRNLIFAIAVSISLSTLAVKGDTLWLSNGDRITGTLEGITDGLIEFNTEYAGLIRLKQDTVAGIDTVNEYSVRFKRGITRDIRIDRSVKIATLDRVLQKRGASLLDESTHRLIGSLAYSRGNSTTQVYVVSSESKLKGVKSEHIFETLLNYDVNEGNLLKNQTQLNYKGRLFLIDDLFFTLTTHAYRDPIKGTDFGFAPVVGLGRKFWDHTYGALSVELGVAGVFEWQEGTDSQSPAWSWELAYSKRFLGGRVEVSHDQRALSSFGQGSLIESNNEIKYSLSQSLDVNFIARFKHDTEVPRGIAKTDITYVAGIGLSF